MGASYHRFERITGELKYAHHTEAYMSDHEELEELRSKFQLSHDLDQGLASRNEQGQYATDFHLARLIVKEAIKAGGFSSRRGLRFFEPSIGSGSFFSALIKESKNVPILSATGVEINPKLASFASSNWKAYGLDVIQSDIFDFIENHQVMSNLIVTNPPYSRHHHIEKSQKIALQELVEEMTGIRLSGLSGLHCYIMAIAHIFLESEGVSAWLVPQEILDVGYSKNLKKILFSQHDIFRIHYFGSNNSKFADASVTSIVVFMRKKSKPCQSLQTIQFTVGEINDPEQVNSVEMEMKDCDKRWSKFFSSDSDTVQEGSSIALSEIISVRRGIATGKNAFFINPLEYWKSIGISNEHLIPIMPPPRRYKQNLVDQKMISEPTFPYLLSVKVEPEKFGVKLSEYIDRGIEEKVNEGYLCSKRPMWYMQEVRTAPDFFLTYIGRHKSTGERMFRFIRNETEAICSNNYLMIYKRKESDLTTDDLSRILNSIPDDELTRCARAYGDGMYKLEPSEVLTLRIKMMD
jgi:adenine-specific DNA-methyltransferase